MLNFKYLTNIFLYFTSVYTLEYIYVTGFYYIIQDYLLVLLAYFPDFSVLPAALKDELKFYFLLLIFFSFLF